MTELRWNKPSQTLGVPRCLLLALLSATQTPVWPGGCAGVLVPALSSLNCRQSPPAPDSFEAGRIVTRLVGELISALWSCVGSRGRYASQWHRPLSLSHRSY